MALSSQITSQIDSVIKAATPTIADIEARADYAKNPEASDVAKLLQSYVLELKTLEANTAATDADTQATRTKTTDTVLPALSDLTSANIALMNMGQLSTKRTIEPAVARTENVLLATLTDQAQTLAALLKGGSGSDAGTSAAAGPGTSTETGTGSDTVSGTASSPDPDKNTGTSPEPESGSSSGTVSGTVSGTETATETTTVQTPPSKSQMEKLTEELTKLADAAKK